MKWTAVLLFGLLTGCATLRPPSPLEGNQDSVFLADVPFVAQKENHCGPAALTMAANHAGLSLQADKVASQLMTPDKQGSFTSDLVGAARRQGLMVIPVHTWDGLRKELRANHPVVMLQNLGLKIWPKWHYAVVTGWDGPRDKVFLHSGGKAHLAESAAYVEHTWALADRWAVVMLKPGTLAASGNEEAHAVAAAALENLGQWREANKAYEAMLTRWPRSRAALLGLGNTRYQLKDVDGAIAALKQGRSLYPKDLMFAHNLAVAYSKVDATRARQLASSVWKRADAQQRQRFKTTLAGLL